MPDNMIEVEAEWDENVSIVKQYESGKRVTIVKIDPDQLRKLGYYKLEEVVIDGVKALDLYKDIFRDDASEEGIRAINLMIDNNPIKLKP